MSLEIFVGSDGKTRVLESETGESVYLHQLLAVADGADPWRVWGDSTVVHHKLGFPDDSGAHVETTENLEVTTRAEHARRHARGLDRPDVESVLNRDDGS